MMRVRPLSCIGNARKFRYFHMGRTCLGLAAEKPIERVMIRNPKFDAKGREMSVEITERASQQLRKVQERERNDRLVLRVIVESGGCHGFQYKLQLTDKVDDKDDTIFELDGSKVVLDETSLELLNGSKVDFTDELIGSQFKVVDNPFATSKCGCDTSFAIDFDKLPSHQR